MEGAIGLLALRVGLFLRGGACGAGVGWYPGRTMDERRKAPLTLVSGALSAEIAEQLSDASASEQDAAEKLFRQSMVPAAEHIVAVVSGEEGTSPLRLKACMYVIERILGHNGKGGHGDAWTGKLNSVLRSTDDPRADYASSDE